MNLTHRFIIDEILLANATIFRAADRGDDTEFLRNITRLEETLRRTREQSTRRVILDLTETDDDEL